MAVQVLKTAGIHKTPPRVGAKRRSRWFVRGQDLTARSTKSLKIYHFFRFSALLNRLGYTGDPNKHFHLEVLRV